MHSELRAVILEALKTLVEVTGHDADALFGERMLEASEMSPDAAHAAGTIEGAALALGVTALELLDEVAVEPR